MENIGRNMAWMLKTLEYSRAAVPLPEKALFLRILFVKMPLRTLLKGRPLFESDKIDMRFPLSVHNLLKS